MCRINTGNRILEKVKIFEYWKNLLHLVHSCKKLKQIDVKKSYVPKHFINMQETAALHVTAVLIHHTSPRCAKLPPPTFYMFYFVRWYRPLQKIRQFTRFHWVIISVKIYSRYWRIGWVPPNVAVPKLIGAHRRGPRNVEKWWA